ncbi:AAA family ATPase [Marinobacter sp. F4216]|uniref:AAA family ATPase n=1 Tax=Marinobacter sp. F4216 TaxID=2874281 RepID=UPI001CBA8428|nr:MoxR family ATPase [Marinobacter sp. F4216]MBZ2169830.1 MoxR family ATPase [Marinobacter sp. F4216]
MSPWQAMNALRERVNSQILGQSELVDQLIVALLANGHVLLESQPGLAKTRTAKTLAQALDATMKRIQFTPDLLPSDLTGSEVLHHDGQHQSFHFEPGPLFGNLILADEINRAPAKVQAALLEAMEERQITVAGHTHTMPSLFMVLATQNPIEQEGTYLLPEAQMDRFLMKITLGYPSHEQECEVLRLVRGEEIASDTGGSGNQQPIASESVLQARKEISELFVSPAIDSYVVDLVHATRPEVTSDETIRNWVETGVSPRGVIALDRAARAHAWLAGQDHVTPDNVRAVCQPVLRHRLRLNYEAIANEVQADQIIDRLLDRVSIPT